jgi:threonine/homoserine/homoserine lactone efflux protein
MSSMPDSAHLAAFLVAVVALALLPGPGMLYVLGRSLGGDREIGLRSTLGTAADCGVALAAGTLGDRLSSKRQWIRRQRRATGAMTIGLGAYAALDSGRG